MTEQAVLQDARRYMAMLHKRRGIVLTCLGVSLALAVLHNYTTRPVYQATTQILIDRDTPNVLPNKELVELVQGGMDYYQTQYQLLKSRTLAERAVERLKLRTHPELATGPMMNPWERRARLLRPAGLRGGGPERHSPLPGGRRLPLPRGRGSRCPGRVS